MANVFRRRAIKAIGSAAMTTGLTLTAASAREHTTTTAAATPSSVVNQYLQCWDVPNVFSFGVAAFPQNITYNHALTIGAATYWALDAIKNNTSNYPDRSCPDERQDS